MTQLGENRLYFLFATSATLASLHLSTSISFNVFLHVKLAKIACISCNTEPIKKVHPASCRATISLLEYIIVYSFDDKLVPAFYFLRIVFYAILKRREQVSFFHIGDE